MEPAILPGGSGIKRRIDIAVTDLPQPEFTDDGERLACFNDEGHAVNRTIDAIRRSEVSLQITDFEERHG